MHDPQSWQSLKKRTYRHSPFLEIDDVTYRMPNGETADYSLFHAGLRIACVVAITKDQKVVLARQFRPGPDRVLDELPGGKVEEGESFEEAIRRELLEETGYEAGKLLPLGHFFESAYSRIERKGFLAFDCERKFDQKLDSTEFIEVVEKPLPEFFEQIRRGLCTDCEIAWAALWEAGFLGKLF